MPVGGDCEFSLNSINTSPSFVVMMREGSFSFDGDNKKLVLSFDGDNEKLVFSFGFYKKNFILAQCQIIKKKAPDFSEALFLVP